MKNIYFLALVFILILVTISFTFPKKYPCLTQEFLYFGTPGFIREGFSYHDYVNHYKKQYEKEYPYSAATHNPTDYIIRLQENTDAFNKKLSDYLNRCQAKGNKYTVNYYCRPSTISYDDGYYNDCGPYPENE